MTVLQIVDTCRAYLQEPLNTARTFPDNTSSFWKDDDMIVYLNLEQHAVANKMNEAGEHFFVTATTIDLVAGTREYSLPDDSVKIIRVESYRDSSSPVEIYPVSFNDTARIATRVSSAGEPNTYSLLGQQIVLSPRPEQTQASGVNITYVYKVPEFISASSISHIPLEFHEILVWGIVKKCLFQQEGTGEALVAASTEYNRLMRDMSKQIEKRQAQRPRRVKRRRFR